MKQSNNWSKEIKNLEQQLEAVKQRANYNEQYSRRWNVRTFGVKSPDIITDPVVVENCTKSVVDFCKNELGVDLNWWEIDTAHYVGRGEGGGGGAKWRETKDNYCEI